MQKLTLTFLSSPQVLENRKTLFVLFFLALGAIVFTAWQGISFIQESRSKRQLTNDAIFSYLNGIKQTISLELGNYAVTLNHLTKSDSLKKFALLTEAPSKTLHELFASLLVASPSVYQLRFLDDSGMEKLRVEHSNNKIIYTPIEQLQDKSNEGYFKKAIQLSAGTLYLSELNLNREFGAVEKQWRPTLRLASPVIDKHGSTKGIVILNIDASGYLNQYLTPSEYTSETQLINSQGYWLLGKPQPELWGFMFNREPDLPSQHPDFWKALTRSNSKIITVDQQDWFTERVRVRDLFSANQVFSDPDKILWYATAAKTQSHWISYLPRLLPLTLIFTALGAFSLAWVKSLNKAFDARKELIKSEKLSSLGGLVAGVSHELNTPLGSALTMASTIGERADEMTSHIEGGQLKKSDILEFIHDMKHASELMQKGLMRASELIGHFKQIAVDQSGEARRSFSLDEYIEELAATFKHLFRHSKIELDLNLEANTNIDSYPGALSQVVINLVNNALIHGFEKEDTGTITITTRAIDNENIELDVVDNGKGITSEVIKHIFEPFYTTKMGQGGSGLGLHITRSIVVDMLNGSIQVESHPNERHTRFKVVFPIRIKTPSNVVNIEDAKNAGQNAA